MFGWNLHRGRPALAVRRGPPDLLCFNAQSELLDEASKRVLGNEGFDIAFDCAGEEATIGAAVESINKGGTIMIVAIFHDKPPMNLAVVGDRELSLVGTLMYQYCDYEEAVRRIAAGDVITDPLDSKHFPFEEYASAYKFIDEKGPKSMKVFIDL